MPDLSEEVAALTLEAPVSISARTATYRDKLLANAQLDGVSRIADQRPITTSSEAPSVPSVEWRPVFSVQKVSYLKQDRLYGQQAGSTPSGPWVEDDDDDDGMWSFIDANARSKAAASLNHARIKTMLTPLQQEKKDARIALKSV